jgi:hypothetical protein
MASRMPQSGMPPIWDGKEGMEECYKARIEVQGNWRSRFAVVISTREDAASLQLNAAPSFKKTQKKQITRPRRDLGMPMWALVARITMGSQVVASVEQFKRIQGLQDRAEGESE